MPDVEIGGWSEELSEKDSRNEAHLIERGAEEERGLETEQLGVVLGEKQQQLFGVGPIGVGVRYKTRHQPHELSLIETE